MNWFQYFEYAPESVDPIGLQVTMDYKGRTLLGDVKDFRYCHVRGMHILKVAHFNGELWPFTDGEVRAGAVNVLERTFESQIQD